MEEAETGDLSEVGCFLMTGRPAEVCERVDKHIDSSYRHELPDPCLPLALVVSLPSGGVRPRAEVAHCSTRRWRWGGYMAGVRIGVVAAEDHDRLAKFTYERS